MYIRGFNSQAHLHQLMLDHLWESELSKQAEKARTQHTRSQVSKGGIAYASDVHRFIAASSNPPDLERVPGGISNDQKVFYLIMKNYVHPALLMCTKERYKRAQQSAINLEKRFDMWGRIERSTKKWWWTVSRLTLRSLLGRPKRHQNGVEKGEKMYRVIENIETVRRIINMYILLL